MEVALTPAPAGLPNIFSQALSLFLLLILLTLTVSILALFLKWIFEKYAFQKSLKSFIEADKAFLLVKVPTTNFQKEEAMEELLKSFHRLLPAKELISLEMVSSEQFLKFYIVIKSHLRNLLESQLYAAYPQAEVEDAPDPLAALDKDIAVTQFDFRKTSLLPIQIYKNSGENLLKNLSALLSKLEPEEKVYFQFILQKPGSHFWEKSFSLLYFKLFGKKYLENSNPTPQFYKFSQNWYSGKFRIAFMAKDKIVAKNKLETLVNLFKGLKSIHNEPRAKTQSHTSALNNFKIRSFYKGDVWSPEEIATIYHFPYNQSLVSNVVSTSSKKSPAPDILPIEGRVDPKEVSFFGETNYRNEQKKFGIKRLDRRRHLYVIGKTGSGKSKLLELLITADILNGEGCCLLDPHGDLADELLMYIPKERINDVIYVNPAESSFPIGFNPLEPVTDNESRQQLSTFFIAIFKKLFAFNWNPRMEHLIRYITLALLETPDSNVLGIPRILSDTAFRQRVIKQIQDPVVKSFWTNEFSAWNERFATDAVIPILNKVGQFIANPIVRNMVGQKTNVLNFEKFMNEGKIVIINISKGKIGDDNAALLGSMFITKIQQAALARAKIPEEERRDFYFYVDEFQNFATDAFSSILSEARKYHLNLTIAHQYMAQLPDDVKATAFGNVGSIITFAIGGDDANYLAKEFAPTFTGEDMINLNLREMYVKMSIDGRLTPPFSARTINVPKPNFDYSVEIVNHSRMTYGKNRTSVENEIAHWSSSTELTGDTASKEDFPEPII